MKIDLKLNTSHNAEILSDSTEDLAVVNGGIATDEQSRRLLSLMLITKLAEDKIGYPIRETLTNAFDACSTKTPIIHFPSQEEPWFSVRDFGPGLRPNQMHRATTLLSSGSRNSGKKAGGFGIGMKSWVAYLKHADLPLEATLTSTTDGVERVYLMTVNSETVEITATLLSETPTEDPSGLMLSWRIRSADITTWNAKLNGIGSLFPSPMRDAFTGLRVVALPASGIEVAETHATHPWQYARSYVRSGGVAYPMPREITEINNLWVKSGHRTLIFDTPLGTVNPAINREVLEADETTINTCRELMLKYQAAIDGIIAEARQNKRAGMQSLPSYVRGHTVEQHWVPDGVPYRGNLSLLSRNCDRYAYFLEGSKRITRQSERLRHIGGCPSEPFMLQPAEVDALRDWGYELVDLASIKLEPKPTLKTKGKALIICPNDRQVKAISFDQIDANHLIVPMVKSGFRRSRWNTEHGYPPIMDCLRIGEEVGRSVYFVSENRLDQSWCGPKMLEWVRDNMDPPPVPRGAYPWNYSRLRSNFFRNSQKESDMFVGPLIAWVQGFLNEHPPGGSAVAEDKTYHKLFPSMTTPTIDLDAEAIKNGWPLVKTTLTTFLSDIDELDYNTRKLSYYMKGIQHDFMEALARQGADHSQLEINLAA